MKAKAADTLLNGKAKPTAPIVEETLAPELSLVEQVKLKLEGLQNLKSSFQADLQSHHARVQKEYADYGAKLQAEWAETQANVNIKIGAAEREIVKTEGVLEFLLSQEKTVTPPNP